MAMEILDLPLTPKVTISSGVELRRHSAGIANSGNIEKNKVVPHYLRASTGSCHDFCKYGRKNVEEARVELSIIKRAGRKALLRSTEEIIGKTSLDSKPTKMSTVKGSELVDSKIQVSNGSDTNKMELPTKSFGSQKQMGNKVLVNASKASLVRSKPSILPKSHISSITKTRRGAISSSFEASSKRVETSPTSNSARVKTHPKSTSQMVKTSPKSMLKMKQTSSKGSSFEDKKMELSDKHVTSLNSDFITMKTVSSVNSFGGQRNSKIKMNKKAASPKSSSRGIASASARKHKGLKIVPHLMNQPIKLELEEKNNEAQEKTLYAIKMESENQTSLSDENESLSLSNSSSSPKFSPPPKSQSSSQEDQEKSEDSCPGNHEIEYTANMDTLEIEEKGGIAYSEEDKECLKLGEKLAETQIEYTANVDTLEAEKIEKAQKDGIVCSEDNECHNIAGKFVETQIEKFNLGSLKFQRGKVLGKNATDVQAVAGIGPEKVLLRHQNMKVKKDGQGLYNIVIDEKASKELVQTQKGKVKALIHAFETVISLEEKRISAKIVN